MKKFLLNRINRNRKKSDQNTFIHKVFGSLAIIPVLAIALGTYTIVNGLSPESLSSTSSLIDGFFEHFGGHAFILIGAFVLTLIVWDITHETWTRTH